MRVTRADRAGQARRRGRRGRARRARVVVPRGPAAPRRRTSGVLGERRARSTVPVVARPTVRLIVTGDELLPPGRRPPARASWTPTASCSRPGAPRRRGERRRRVRSPIDATPSARRSPRGARGRACSSPGGSSVGPEDHAPRCWPSSASWPCTASRCAPRARPASASSARARGPSFLLPGNPVSCLCAYEFFAGPTLRALGGRRRAWPHLGAPRPVAREARLRARARRLRARAARRRSA